MGILSIRKQRKPNEKFLEIIWRWIFLLSDDHTNTNSNIYKIIQEYKNKIKNGFLFQKNH